MKPKLHVLRAGDEQQLITALRAGDERAFQALHHRYMGRVLGLARQLLRSSEAAEDAAQETFLRVFRSVHTFKGTASLATWIHRIATNVCFSELSKRKRSDERVVDEPAPQPSVEHEVENRELVLQLQTLLHDMDARKQATFYLHYVDGLSAAEVADVLEESRDAVLKRLQRTRQELLKRWKKEKARESAKAKES